MLRAPEYTGKLLRISGKMEVSQVCAGTSTAAVHYWGLMYSYVLTLVLVLSKTLLKQLIVWRPAHVRRGAHNRGGALILLQLVQQCNWV